VDCFFFEISTRKNLFFFAFFFHDNFVTLDEANLGRTKKKGRKKKTTTTTNQPNGRRRVVKKHPSFASLFFIPFSLVFFLSCLSILRERRGIKDERFVVRDHHEGSRERCLRFVFETRYQQIDEKSESRSNTNTRGIEDFLFFGEGERGRRGGTTPKNFFRVDSSRVF
tara:strand:- start:4958 stop:5461 length:504 start_codon:yes stop_codon:yes gene_type:complete